MRTSIMKTTALRTVLFSLLCSKKIIIMETSYENSVVEKKQADTPKENLMQKVQMSIRDFMRTELGIKAVDIFDSAKLHDDLGLDSLDRAQLIVHLEDLYTVELPYKTSDDMTIEELVQSVCASSLQ